MILRIDPMTDGRWQALVDRHPSAGIFHTNGWLEALQRTYGYVPVVYAATGVGPEIVSGIPFCRIRSRLTGRRLVSLPFSDHCQPLVGSPAPLDELILAVKDDAKMANCKYVEIRPLIPYEPSVLTAVDLARSNDAVIHRLNLRRNREDILRGFHKQCVHRTIARGEREQLRYEEGTSEDLLRKFYRLLLLTRRRHQLLPQPLAWFRNLIACLGKHIKIRVASKEDTPVASIITLSFKQVVTYKYSCSDARFNSFGGTVLLIWRTIQDAMDDGACELDLGRSDSDNAGLISFKDHWGAARETVAYYRYPQAAQHISGNGKLAAAARRFVTTIPDSLFATLGGVLYRHVG